MSEKIYKSDREWREQLTEDQYTITRKKANLTLEVRPTTEGWWS
jgi:hypothetical protein